MGRSERLGSSPNFSLEDQELATLRERATEALRKANQHM